MGDFLYVRELVVASKVLYPIVIILITIILARTTLYVLEGILRLQKRSLAVNHRLLSVVEVPVIVIIILIGTELAVRSVLEERGGFTQLLLSVSIVVLTYVLINVGAIMLDAWSKHMSQVKGDAFHSEILPMLKSVLSIALSLLGVLLVLQVWKVEIKTILTSLGVVSVILGFAFKETLENVFGGISLIMDNAFRKGDVIVLEDGQMGEVMEINLRSTRIRDFNHETLIVPNGKLSNSKITNLAQPTPTVRINIPVCVAYGSDPEKVKTVLHDSLAHHKDILSVPRRQARFVGLGERGLEFELFFYINDYRRMWDIKDEVLSKIYKELSRVGIPFAHRKS